MVDNSLTAQHYLNSEIESPRIIDFKLQELVIYFYDFVVTGKLLVNGVKKLDQMRM